MMTTLKVKMPAILTPAFILSDCMRYVHVTLEGKFWQTTNSPNTQIFSTANVLHYVANRYICSIQTSTSNTKYIRLKYDFTMFMIYQ